MQICRDAKRKSWIDRRRASRWTVTRFGKVSLHGFGFHVIRRAGLQTNHGDSTGSAPGGIGLIILSGSDRTVRALNIISNGHKIIRANGDDVFGVSRIARGIDDNLQAVIIVARISEGLRAPVGLLYHRNLSAIFR